MLQFPSRCTQVIIIITSLDLLICISNNKIILMKIIEWLCAIIIELITTGTFRIRVHFDAIQQQVIVQAGFF